MEKLVVTSGEAQAVQLAADPLALAPKTPRPIPLWARGLMLPTVLVLPFLCLVTVVIRIALRASAPRTREAWNAYLNTLLVSSALLSMIAGVVLFSAYPVPPQSISAGMSDLDERASFPTLPSASEMKGVEVAATLKPLVMIATPIAGRWFSKGDQPSGLVGAALLLAANQDGYLFATARHVADGLQWKLRKTTGRVLLSSGLGGWGSADVIARHRYDDVALLWVPRHYGSGEFVQPVAESASPGSTVYVI